MLAVVPRPKLILAVCAIALFACLTGMPSAGASTATTSDQADAYGKAIEQAKKKRSAKLKACAAKPTKAKRDACRKAANAAFATAKAKAEEKRDEANGDDQGATSPAKDEADELRDCLKEHHGDKRECIGG